MARVPENTAPSAAALSPREAQIIEMAGQGLTNVQIAERLAVTPHVVKFHLASVYRKLGAANRTEAAVVYMALQRTS